MQYTIYLLVFFAAIIAITTTPNTPPQPLLTASAQESASQNTEAQTSSADPSNPAGPAEAKPAATASVAVQSAPQQQVQAAGAPVRVSIPAIGLNKRIVKVGINSVGEMDVPSGSTQNVGWYSKGVAPGNVGSAVLAAHVFAAFGALHKTEVGDEIFVEAENGGHLRFVVTKTEVYKLGDLSADTLFNRKDGRHLHLITCAGAPTSDGSTYTHRLVVYATLAP